MVIALNARRNVIHKLVMVLDAALDNFEPVRSAKT